MTNMNIKSLSNDEMKSKLAPAAKNTSTATINSYSTAFYQVGLYFFYAPRRDIYVITTQER